MKQYRCFQVTALGHSAGAQLWAMVLLNRARARRACHANHQSSAVSPANGGAELAKAVEDTRMPVRFIGKPVPLKSGCLLQGTYASKYYRLIHKGHVPSALHFKLFEKENPVVNAGMAGVYNIAKHYEYEAGRGVQYLSTMERAIGGLHSFASQSPAVVLASAAQSSRKESAQAQQSALSFQ